jgi:hypothetical protein
VQGCRLDNQAFGLPQPAGKRSFPFFRVSKLALAPTHSTMKLTFGTGVLHLIQINHQPDATVFPFIILTFVYS